MKSVRLKLRDNIRVMRKKQKLTQEQMAEVAGIDYKYVQKIEGTNPPNMKVDTIEKIARALKTTPARLLEF